MSHPEEALRKMTPRIRIVAPDTLPPTVAFVNLVWEEGFLCPSLEFQDEACVGSLFLGIRGRETTLARRLLPARLSETFHSHTSLERGHAFCFTDEGAEVRDVKWFEHSQDWNPGFPEAGLLSVFAGEKGVEHEVPESHHLPWKVLCPKQVTLPPSQCRGILGG